MRYTGGKARIGKHLAPIIEKFRTPGEPIVEPFSGGANLTALLTGERIASDNNPFVIAFWNALQEGWNPPDTITKEIYQAVKSNPGNYPAELVGFLATGCSFGGKWFGSFAPLAATSRSACLKQLEKLQGVRFLCRPYADALEQGLVYCDPPYRGTAQEYNTRNFDHATFDNVVEAWSEKRTVLVSEFAGACPKHWELVWTRERVMKINNAKPSKVTEALYRVRIR